VLLNHTVESTSAETMMQAALYALCLCLSLALHYYFYGSDESSHVFSVCFLAYALTYFDQSYKKDGHIWPWFQRLSLWKLVSTYLDGRIDTEVPLDHDTNYIFAVFPHGCNTIAHGFIMTDCVGMLSRVHKGERRDLAASVLFFIPLLREILLWWGCVDASKRTAEFNLRKKRSLQIYVGGEKEQLLTKEHEAKIFIHDRKGFVKLALKHRVCIVPCYVFGENELYTTSNFAIGFRKWLQKTFAIGVPICFGRWGTWVPFQIPLQIEMGKPIALPEGLGAVVSQVQVDDYHDVFVNEMTRLFERTKGKHGLASDVKLQVL